MGNLEGSALRPASAVDKNIRARLNVFPFSGVKRAFNRRLYSYDGQYSSPR